MSEGAVVVGIAVSEARLDAALTPGEERWSTGNDAAGIADLLQPLQARHPTLIVLEAAGALAAAGLPVVVAT
jgi:hypothetical protein